MTIIEYEKLKSVANVEYWEMTLFLDEEEDCVINVKQKEK